MYKKFIVSFLQLFGPQTLFSTILSSNPKWLLYLQAICIAALQYGAAYPRMSEKEPEKFEIIRKMMALPLLPADDIERTFKIIKEEAESKFKNFFMKFCEKYIEGYWFKNKARGPHSITVYNQLNRTNNDNETYH
ncbi:hypothetical protein QAD02_007433 [Eretmocerus hayati]|uniref:Uncharacterized protein n=1 Tax=Eretmocerus hayati TaxID=131215 RepID=A0ACC2N4Z2_9HYME|nr:hypothetical protein QAD02_007433 [Eretmocerus hayati]